MTTTPKTSGDSTETTTSRPSDLRLTANGLRDLTLALDGLDGATDLESFGELSVKLESGVTAVVTIRPDEVAQIAGFYR